MWTRRTMLGKAGAALVAAMAFPEALRAQAGAGDISGTYRVEGRNPDGSAYSGRLTVAESVGGTVAFAWIVANQSYAGTGRREGRIVTVDWGADYPVIYVVMPDGALHGTWADGKALERAVK